MRGFFPGRGAPWVCGGVSVRVPSSRDLLVLTLFWIVFWAGLAALVVAAGVSLHVRRKEAIASDVPLVDDEAVQRILRTGELSVADPVTVDLDLILEDAEPLDQEEIDDEEERFWSESWDEPTEW